MLKVFGFNKFLWAGDACTTFSVPYSVFLLRYLQPTSQQRRPVWHSELGCLLQVRQVLLKVFLKHSFLPANWVIKCFYDSTLKVTFWRLDWPISTEPLSMLVHTIKSLLWFTKCTIKSQWLIKPRRRLLQHSRSASEFIRFKRWLNLRPTATATTERSTT